MTRKEKKHSNKESKKIKRKNTAVIEKRKFVLNSILIKPFKMIINHFLFRKLIQSQFLLFEIKTRKKYQKQKLGLANS